MCVRHAEYSGNIVGIGPRYCPSIEDKIFKFKDKDSHQIFIEPEGINKGESCARGALMTKDLTEFLLLGTFPR